MLRLLLLGLLLLLRQEVEKLLWHCLWLRCCWLLLLLQLLLLLLDHLLLLG